MELYTVLVASPVEPSTHRYKYSLYAAYFGQRLVCYDNERGKGDHRRINGEERRYEFVSMPKLVDDFWADVLDYCGVTL